MKRSLVCILISLAMSSLAQAQSWQPDFNPAAFKGPATGPANEVMVLGSPHLSYMPASFNPVSLTELNARLAAWHPQAIAIEALSGVQCDNMRHYPQRYADTVKSYCRDTSAARQATQLDVIAATERVAQMLTAWSTQATPPGPSQRRQLAAVFLAGGEQASAMVQWLRLAEAERHEGDGLDAALVQMLRTLETKHDESLLIAARLAATLGQERVYPMDDHTSDSVDPDPKAAGAAIMKAWDNPATRQRRVSDDALKAKAVDGAGVLAMYRAANAPGSAKLAFESDFGAAMNEPSPQRFGRGYLGYWETRNLRMASNIREVLEERPGMRMLVVVGSSHKAYLEAYLNQMHDVRIVDTGPLLR
jgi:hypothetical protein